MRRVLLERERETEILRDVVGRPALARGALAVVEGDPGIGKTTLLEAARDIAADRGLRLLAGRGGELERDLTFGVARQVLEAPVRGTTLGGAARPAAPLLGVGEPEGEVDEPSLVHALYWTCADLAAHEPLCVTIDDAHWADAASLRWLVYLARRLDELPVALLVAARTGEPGAPQELLDTLAAQADEQRRLLRPSALTPRATEALVRRETGAAVDERLYRTVHELAGGNPLLVREAAATAAEGASPEDLPGLRPHALARSVLRRLDRLADPATALARAVAILDRDATLGHAAALAGADADAAARAADDLAAARILRPGRPLAFVHPIVRSTLYDAIPEG